MLAYEPLLIEAGISGIFMAVSNCADQLQQPGSRFPFGDMVYRCFQKQIFLELFVHGLWSETLVSAAPLKHIFCKWGSLTWPVLSKIFIT